MSITFSIDGDTRLLKICFQGMTCVEQIHEVIDEIARHHLEEGLNLVLVDSTHGAESLGLVELLEVSQAITDPAFDGMRVALYAGTPNLAFEFTKQVTTIEPNGAHARIFRDEPTARAWLLEQV